MKLDQKQSTLAKTPPGGKLPLAGWLLLLAWACWLLSLLVMGIDEWNQKRDPAYEEQQRSIKLELQTQTLK